MSIWFERQCPKCGSGLASGVRYPSCAEFPDLLRKAAHDTFCRNFAPVLCNDCANQEEASDG